LFVRTHDGMAPTARAEDLAGPIRHALSTMRDAVERDGGFNPRTSERTFRIFISDIDQMVLFPSIVAAVSREAPQVALETVLPPSSRVRTTVLESGNVDLALGLLQEYEGSIRCEALYEEHYCGMVRADHSTISGKVTLSQLLQSQHCVYQDPADGAEECSVELALNSAGIDRRVAIRLAHAIGIPNLLAESDLLMIVPHRFALACGKMMPIQIVSIPVDLPRFHVAQYWHDRYHTEPGGVWLRGVISQLFSSKPSSRNAKPVRSRATVSA
jgi:DNA-binding transcriptional LysR family regulator